MRGGGAVESVCQSSSHECTALALRCALENLALAEGKTRHRQHARTHDRSPRTWGPPAGSDAARSQAGEGGEAMFYHMIVDVVANKNARRPIICNILHITQREFLFSNWCHTATDPSFQLVSRVHFPVQPRTRAHLDYPFTLTQTVTLDWPKATMCGPDHPAPSESYTTKGR